jgi:translation initiation factor IF-2
MAGWGDAGRAMFHDRVCLQEEKEKMRIARIAEISTSSSVTLSTLATVDEGQEGLQRMNLVVKADATGTVEAVKGALMGLPQDTVSLRFLLAATGSVTTSDIDLARTSGAIIVAFNTVIPDDCETLAKSTGVEVLKFNVIYDLLDQVRARMEGKIKAVQEQVPRGSAEVKALFGRGKSIIAGCLVTEGKLMKKGVVEVTRGRKKVVYSGPLTSLRRFKDEVEVVDEGVECGVGCEEFWEWQEGDVIQFFELVERTLTLEQSRAHTAIDFDEAMQQFEEEYAESLRAAEEQAREEAMAEAADGAASGHTSRSGSGGRTSRHGRR